MSFEITISDSGTKTFQRCRKKWRYRYIDRIEPQRYDVAPPLTFGRAWHEAQEAWGSWDHATNEESLKAAQSVIDAGFVEESETHCRLSAMLGGYAVVYPREADDFTTIAQEIEFEAAIVNPDTGRPARVVNSRGISDGLILGADGLGIHEHKTTSRIDSAYLDGLWTASQTGLYAEMVSRIVGQPVRFVLYDIVEKAPKRMRRHEGETIAQFESRHEAACAKNSSGKTSITRRMPETWEAYRARLVDWHSDPFRYTRVHIAITPDRIESTRRYMWSVAQDITHARRAGTFYEDRSNCRNWGRECEFLPLCDSGDSPIVLANLYRERGSERKNHGSELQTSPF